MKADSVLLVQNGTQLGSADANLKGGGNTLNQKAMCQ